MQASQPQNPQAPQSPQSPQDLAAQAQAQQLVLDTAKATIRRLLNFRRPFDAKRAQFYKQYLAKRDGQTFPDGVTKRANASVPYAWSNVEEIAARTNDAFFAMEPWFEVRPRGANDGDAAEKMELVENYMLRKAHWPAAFDTLVKNILIYGHGAVKVDWDFDYDQIVYPDPIYIIDPQTGQPLINPQTGQPVVRGYKPGVRQIPRACPKFIPIDIYDFLVDPDGGITAHLTERTWGQLQKEAAIRKDYWFPDGIAKIAEAFAGKENADAVVIRMAEIWNDYDKTCTVITTTDKEGLSWKDTRAAYRSLGGYTPYKREMLGKDEILLWHGQNPFLHQHSAILHTGYVKLPNEVFGVGAIEPISDLTQSYDNFVNMIADNWNLGINRRYAFDVNAEIDTEALNSFNTPGGKVGVLGDPNKVLAPLPFFTPNANDYQILPVFKGFIELASGVSDFYSKGVGSSGSNDTATGINSIITESSHRFRVFMRNLEFDIVQPMLQMVASLIQQFTTDQIEVMLTDGPPAIQKYPVVAPEELLGSFSFEIVAANYTSNKTVRQRNFLAFYNVAAQSPFWNQYEGLKEVAKIFEIRNPGRLLNPPQQVQMQQAQQQQQQMQMAIASKFLDAEAKAMIAEVGKKDDSGATQKHGLAVQEVVEEYLQSIGEMPGAPHPQPHMQPMGKKEGRPAQSQFEGAIPGAGNTSAVRDIAQLGGANALGLSGMGEGNAG